MQGYYIVHTGLPVGGWYVLDQDQNIVRFGHPIGQMPKRFKTPEAADKAAKRLFRLIAAQEDIHQTF